jgi:hypothetical protein
MTTTTTKINSNIKAEKVGANFKRITIGVVTKGELSIKIYLSYLRELKYWQIRLLTNKSEGYTVVGHYANFITAKDFALKKLKSLSEKK